MIDDKTSPSMVVVGDMLSNRSRLARHRGVLCTIKQKREVDQAVAKGLELRQEEDVVPHRNKRHFVEDPVGNSENDKRRHAGLRSQNISPLLFLSQWS